mmetsp:Transcript_4033/g.11466  ORF Transcript_4033/g.11466 Transcript_4033/m.11466 type:complete len:238 (+) Transcript_4033:922-1635(+)
MTTAPAATSTSLIAPTTTTMSFSSRLLNRKDWHRPALSFSFWSSVLATIGGTKTFFVFHSPKASADTLARVFDPTNLSKSGGGSTSSSSSSSASSRAVSFAAATIATSCMCDFSLTISSARCLFSSMIRSRSSKESSLSSSSAFLPSRNSSMKLTGFLGILCMHSAAISSSSGFSTSRMYFFFSSGTPSWSRRATESAVGSDIWARPVGALGLARPPGAPRGQRLPGRGPSGKRRAA